MELKIGEVEENSISGKTQSPACTAPRDTGRCRGRFLNWFFDPETYERLTFNYGGYAGNESRNETKAECELACKHGKVYRLPCAKTDSDAISILVDVYLQSRPELIQ